MRNQAERPAFHLSSATGAAQSKRRLDFNFESEDPRGTELPTVAQGANRVAESQIRLGNFQSKAGNFKIKYFY